MKNLSKVQKVIICTHLLYFLIVLMITFSIDDKYECLLNSHTSQIIILTFPSILYLLGLWIWGFGYVVKAIKQHKKTTIFIMFSAFVALNAPQILELLYYPTYTEKLNGCILPSFEYNKTCLNNRVYYNTLLKDIINNKPFKIKDGKRIIGVNDEDKYRWSYATYNINLNKQEIEEIKSIENELKEKGFTDIFEMLDILQKNNLEIERGNTLHDTEWEDVVVR